MLQIDRLSLADFFTPKELVNEIFKQCPDLNFPIPVTEIAMQCGILEIIPLALPKETKFEGGLVSDTVKDLGVIFYKQHSSIIGRERFTIGHELGHHLLQHHAPNNICLDGFKNSINKNFEEEANSFSELLLMPEFLIKEQLRGKKVSLKTFIEIAEKAEVSFSAMANKCCSLLNKERVILVYSHNNICKYCWASWKVISPFKFRRIKKKELPKSSSIMNSEKLEDEIGELALVPATVWFEESNALPANIYEQTFYQEDGHAVTMISISEEL